MTMAFFRGETESQDGPFSSNQGVTSLKIDANGNMDWQKLWRKRY